MLSLRLDQGSGLNQNTARPRHGQWLAVRAMNAAEPGLTVGGKKNTAVGAALDQGTHWEAAALRRGSSGSGRVHGGAGQGSGTRAQ